jgi:hypothetical protein
MSTLQFASAQQQRAMTQARWLMIAGRKLLSWWSAEVHGLCFRVAREAL